MPSQRSTCPHCGADLTGDPIPEQWRDRHDGQTDYGREIAVDKPGEFDVPCSGAVPTAAAGGATGPEQLARQVGA